MSGLRPDDVVPIATVTRGGIVESVHHGLVVALDRDGEITLARGNPDAIVYPRSSNKPMQAVAMVRAGLRLSPQHLALVCASHDGTPMHLHLACDILAGAGLDESALRNTPALPLDEASAHDVIRRGGGPTALQMNCSGKHAGMVATCVVNGWPLDGYLEPDHPLQFAITATIAELTGEPPAHVGVDGCRAPAHAMTLVGLARGFRSIATRATDGDDACAAVVQAMTSWPDVVGGELRDVTALMRAVPDLMAKDGAEGVYAAALPDGRAVAMKIADGSSRGRAPVMAAALRELGVDVEIDDDAATRSLVGG